MQQRPPAEPGMHESEIDTPALIIDLDALEANMDAMAAACRTAGVRLRPHAKTHKSPVIAHWQRARGAIGQCVQKPAEAEVLAWGGVEDILVSNEVVAPAKLKRLAALTRMARISLCLDDPRILPLIEEAAAALATRLNVLVEIDVMGGARCGVAPGPGAAELAARIAASPHLTFGGLQAYHGAAQHMRQVEERRAAIHRAGELTRHTMELIALKGLSCDIVGGAGTGTFALEADSGVYNELQTGSYIFMDADYARNDPAPAFRQSLFVLSTVMSAQAGRVVVDCGHKGVAVDSGLPLVAGWDGRLTCVGASDEHGTLALAGGITGPAPGEMLRLVPGHCDPTVDRYDWYVGLRGERVETVFPVAARGMMQ